LGIEARLAQLLLNVKDENVAMHLTSAFERMIAPQQMGTIYKAMAITNLPNTSEPLPGFEFGLS
jgi:SAM-dependent MidA family methyltransferase